MIEFEQGEVGDVRNELVLLLDINAEMSQGITIKTFDCIYFHLQYLFPFEEKSTLPLLFHSLQNGIQMIQQQFKLIFSSIHFPISPSLSTEDCAQKRSFRYSSKQFRIFQIFTNHQILSKTYLYQFNRHIQGSHSSMEVTKGRHLCHAFNGTTTRSYHKSPRGGSRHISRQEG